MKIALLSIFAPAVAIFAGALLQQIVVWSWPGVQTHAIGNLSVESYIGVIAIGLLSFWIGREIWRRAPAPKTAVLLSIVPVVWLLKNLLQQYRPAFTAGTLGVVFFLTALAPLIGIAAALAWPSNPRLERP